jgi:hypothetical protein
MPNIKLLIDKKFWLEKAQQKHLLSKKMSKTNCKTHQKYFLKYFFKEYVTRPQLIVLFIFSTQSISHNFSILFLLFPGSGSRRNCSKVWCCPGYFPYKKRKKRKAFFVAACQKASRELLSQIEIKQCAVIYFRLRSFKAGYLWFQYGK